MPIGILANWLSAEELCIANSKYFSNNAVTLDLSQVLILCCSLRKVLSYLKFHCHRVLKWHLANNVCSDVLFADNIFKKPV